MRRCTRPSHKNAAPQPKRNPLASENEKLRRQNQRLQEEREKAHIVIEVQKKVARLLGPACRDARHRDIVMGGSGATARRGGREAGVPGLGPSPRHLVSPAAPPDSSIF